MTAKEREQLKKSHPDPTGLPCPACEGFKGRKAAPRMLADRPEGSLYQETHVGVCPECAFKTSLHSLRTDEGRQYFFSRREATDYHNKVVVPKGSNQQEE